MSVSRAAQYNGGTKQSIKFQVKSDDSSNDNFEQVNPID